MALMKLLGLCLAMFGGAYVCGELPLRCPISHKNMKYITTIGVGLLIGVSFVVIIPEGVHTYYGATPSTASIMPSNPLSTTTIANLTLLSVHHKHDFSHEQNNYGHANAHLEESPEIDAASHDHDHEHSDDEDDSAHSHQECVDLGRSSSMVGLALISGFVVMFLVDRLGGGEEGHAHGGMDSPEHDHGASTLIEHESHSLGNRDLARRSESPTLNSPSSATHGLVASTSCSSIDECKQLRVRPPQMDQDDEDEQHPLRQANVIAGMGPATTGGGPIYPTEFDQTATVGILVHSAIDGLALGAISVSDNNSLELVVFMAIILHKAPAAFGLTSFLLHQGRTASEVRKHLLYFSLAAPLTSLATFIAFGYYNSLAGSNSLSASSPDGQAVLGLCLLFSAGTFLFTIAAHILPEIQQGGGGGGAGGSHKATDWWSMIWFIGGILAPLLIPSHDHGH